MCARSWPKYESGAVDASLSLLKKNKIKNIDNVESIEKETAIYFLWISSLSRIPILWNWTFFGAFMIGLRRYESTSFRYLYFELVIGR